MVSKAPVRCHVGRGVIHPGVSSFAGEPRMTNEKERHVVPGWCGRPFDFAEEDTRESGECGQRIPCETSQSGARRRWPYSDGAGAPASERAPVRQP